MSDEIRGPMNGVIGMTARVLASELTAEQRASLEIVKSSADRLLCVIHDVLDFSRIEAGKLELDLIHFVLRDAIGDAANAVAFRAHQKGLELIVDIDAAVPSTVRGDPGRLRQILVNLLGNAIKFTHEGEVALRVTSDASTPPGVVLHFSVTDTGVGIAVDRQHDFFEAFTRAGGSDTPACGETGLGLTISSQLVQLMGGRVWIESEVGRGSTVRFTANVVAVNDHADATTVPDTVDLQGRSVLIVDDNATSLHLLEAMVIGWGMVPTLAARATDALSVLRAANESGRPIHLVLTDFEIPDADGFTLAEAIKKDAAIAGAAVVMLTSAGQRGDAARCRSVGIAAYLSKPIRGSELHSALLLALRFQSAEGRTPTLVTRHSIREVRPAGRILLVEDNGVNQTLARRLLEARGHTVVIANSGIKALAILDDAPPVGFDCVIMDVQTPEMQGVACTAIIREREQATGFHLPIIAMTGHGMDGDEARSLAGGLDGYLTKPVDPDALFDAVERYLAPQGVK